MKARTGQYINSSKNKRAANIIEEIMVQFAYPRLDIAVSKGMNHLLKAPFCVHPKTGRVCIPFNANEVDKLNPELVPTVAQLLDEIDEYKSTAAEESSDKTKDYKKTSLKEYINIFEEFLTDLKAEWKGELIARSDES